MNRLRVAMFGVVLAAVGGCAPTAPPDVVRVGMTTTIDMLPIYAMEAEGIAARHGFVIEESEPLRSGMAGIEALAAGEVDVTYPGIVPAIAAAGQGLVPAELAIVGLSSVVTSDTPSGALLVREGIDECADLTGRTIGLHNLTSITAAAFFARATAEGLTDFEVVIVDMADMGLAVRDGTLDAAVTEEPWTTQSALRSDGQILAFTKGEPPLATVPIAVIAVSSALAADEDLLRRFLRAQLEAVRFIHDQPERARALLVPELAISAEVAQQLHLRDYPLDARLDIAAVEALQELIADTDAAGPPIDPETFYSEAILEAVLGEGR